MRKYKTEEIEYCTDPSCVPQKAKVEWAWDRTKPGAWGEKLCEVCGRRYAGIFCPYIPDIMKKRENFA